MAKKVNRENFETGGRDGQEYKGRRLRLVKPRSNETKRPQPITKEKGMESLIRAVEHFLRSLKILKPLPEKVRVKDSRVISRHNERKS